MGSMKTSDFDYELPESLIAREPVARRDSCRLLHVPAGEAAPFEHLMFHDLPQLLRAGDVLVLNDTRVIRARLLGRGGEEGQGPVEIFLLSAVEAPDGVESGEGEYWRCLGRPGRRLRVGSRVELPGGAVAHVVGIEAGGERVVSFELPAGLASVVDYAEAHGHPPLPPYILQARKHLDGDHAPAHERDVVDYQTVYAREGRSVAAPTAGLHLTQELLQTLSARGVGVVRVRLDVGAGTFRPVEAENPAEHPMHEEPWWVEPESAAVLNAALAAGNRVIAVGTTSLRVIESAVEPDGTMPGGWRVTSGQGATRLMILPGWRFRVASGLITNFHLPRSTLLMLVSAVSGRERILAAYREAVAREYRLFSYGDACLLWMRVES